MQLSEIMNNKTWLNERTGLSQSSFPNKQTSWRHKLALEYSNNAFSNNILKLIYFEVKVLISLIKRSKKIEDRITQASPNIIHIESQDVPSLAAIVMQQEQSLSWGSAKCVVHVSEHHWFGHTDCMPISSFSVPWKEPSLHALETAL